MPLLYFCSYTCCLVWRLYRLYVGPCPSVCQDRFFRNQKGFELKLVGIKHANLLIEAKKKTVIGNGVYTHIAGKPKYLRVVLETTAYRGLISRLGRQSNCLWSIDTNLLNVNLDSIKHLSGWQLYWQITSKTTLMSTIVLFILQRKPALALIGGQYRIRLTQHTSWH